MPDAEDALTVAGRGLAVFPLPPGSKKAGPGWERRCTSDPAVLARTWPAGANIGVGCRASGIVGLDLDRHPGKPDGIASFARLAGEHGAGWPSTFTVATPSGGLHLYFRVRAGDRFASAIGWLPGIDTRGQGQKTGGYLAAPGSVIAVGRYVVAADVEIAPLPPWLSLLLPVICQFLEHRDGRPVSTPWSARTRQPLPTAPPAPRQHGTRGTVTGPGQRNLHEN